MPTNNRAFTLTCAPGVKRDGTLSEGDQWVDSQHVRFYRNLPISMGGYNALFNSVAEVVRGDLYLNSNDGVNTVYGGSASHLYGWQFLDNGTPQEQIERTPSGFAANAANIWQIDAMDYNPGGYQALVAHAAPNLDLYSSVATPVYYGDINATTPLVPIQDATQPFSIALLQSISANSIALVQAVAGAGNATLNGVLVTGGVATPNTAQQVSLVTTSGANTSQTATVTGTDINGNPQVQTVTFTGTTPVNTPAAFATVTQIAISAALTGNLTVGTVGHLLLNGSYASNNVAILDQPRQVSIVSFNSADTTQTALITGFDANGLPQTQTLTFNGITPVLSSDLFASVTSVYINKTLLGQIQAGTGSVNLTVSGGIVGVYPYLFVYGSGGRVQWSIPGDLTNFSDIDGGAGEQRISAQKVVRGEQDRSSGASQPAAIFFTLDKLVRANFTQLSESSSVVNTFGFSSVPGYSGILSSSSVVEYDGQFMWPSAGGRFEVYNGIVQELPNTTNLLWFYQNVNMNYRQKIFGMKNSAWGEVSWWFPFGSSTECNAVITYNVRQNCWYSTMLSRSAGIYSTTFPNPIMTDNTTNSIGDYSVWMMEVGQDEVQGSSIQPIQKYIQSCEFSYLGTNPIGLPVGIDTAVLIDRVELDMIQTGDMDFTFLGRDYPRQTDITNTTTFSTTDVDIQVQFQSRQPRVQLTSNTVGGSFQLGRNAILIKLQDGDNTYGSP